ncbi:MAG: ribosome silencing factor [Pseudomonadales bacterium]
MQSELIIEAAIEALEDIKARDIETIDVRGKSTVTDYMLVASGTSKRHVVSIAAQVTDTFKEKGLLPIGSEGQASGDWVLVDFGDVVVHVLTQESREFYQLEKLWRFDPALESERTA